MVLNEHQSVPSHLMTSQRNVLSDVTRPSYHRHVFFPAVVLHYFLYTVVFLTLLYKLAFYVCLISAVCHMKYLQPLDTLCKANVCVCVFMYVYIYIYIFFFPWRSSSQWALASSFTRFLDHRVHTHTHIYIYIVGAWGGVVVKALLVGRSRDRFQVVSLEFSVRYKYFLPTIPWPWGRLSS